jgi:protein phosphatase
MTKTAPLEKISQKTRKNWRKIRDGAATPIQRTLERLRQRGLGHKRSLALREFALGIEAITRFVANEPLYRVHECVFAVLALESDPIDPRL